MSVELLSYTFGQVEAALSRVHRIADSKRTAFQARLKNFHRLGYPVGFASAQGRANVYSPGTAAEMAIALEMTQLGLGPERICHILSKDPYPAMMALRMGAEGLVAVPEGFDAEREQDTDPLSMFLYFDPSALHSLSSDTTNLGSDRDPADATFFFGGAGVVREGIVRWTIGPRNRLSFINITALLDELAWALVTPHVEAFTDEHIKTRRAFFEELVSFGFARIDAMRRSEKPDYDKANAEKFDRSMARSMTHDLRPMKRSRKVPSRRKERHVDKEA